MFYDYLREAIEKAWQFFDKGGVLAWPILGCSLIALAVIIERWWTYRKVTGSGEAWFSEAMDSLGRGDFDGIAKALSNTLHPSARVLSPLLDKFRSAGRFSRNSLDKLASHYGTQEVRELERYLPTLSTIGNVAPLLGLMGTVLGMVQAFIQIEAMQGKVNASVLAGGIWEALLTTLYGLGVAIPTLIAHNYLSARVGRIAGEIQDHAVSFVDALEETHEQGTGKHEAGAGPALVSNPGPGESS
jgi:biopolymer transport protein ExbB